MKNSKNELNFQGENIYVGIDVHKKQWHISIIVSGIRMKTFSMEPRPEDLVRYLEKKYPGGNYYSVYEAGFSGYWIDRRLRSLGVKNIIVNPADVPTSHKEKTRKTDKIDSRKLARELSNGTLEGIYVPSEEEEPLRLLSRLRRQLTKDQTRIKNRIKSLLSFLGVELPDNSELHHWSRRFIDYLSRISLRDAVLKITLEEHIKELLNIREQILRVIREIKKEVSRAKEREAIVRLLATIPGIGYTTAVTIYCELLEIERFSSLDKLSSYIGLVPSCSSSGEKERVGGISNRHNTILRNNLIESAWISIKNDPALTLSYSKLCKRMKRKEAIVRIAKKLLNRIMYVWRTKQPYKLSVVQ